MVPGLGTMSTPQPTMETTSNSGAAAQLGRSHDGVATLVGELSELDTRSIAGIITAAATDPEAARVLIPALGGWPLRGPPGRGPS